jgi:hypothetical protein
VRGYCGCGCVGVGVGVGVCVGGGGGWKGWGGGRGGRVQQLPATVAVTCFHDGSATLRCTLIQAGCQGKGGDCEATMVVSTLYKCDDLANIKLR